MLRATVVGVLLAAALLLAWMLAQVILLLFAAIVLATALRALSSGVSRVTGWPHRWALRASIAAAIALVGGVAYLFGSQLLLELEQLAQTLPSKLDAVGRTLGIPDLRAQLLNWPTANQSAWLLSNLPSYASGTVEAIGGAVVVLASGVYLALDPHTYRKGFLRLFPAKTSERLGSAFDAAGEALRHWVLGQLATMAMVGAATGTGLMIIGLPSAIPLGLIAAVLEFVPFFGPIAAAIPALLLAFSQGWGTLWWVLALYVVVQQVENNLLVPLIQRGLAHLPPVVGMFSTIGMGLLFGPLGLFMGTPLAVVVLAMMASLSEEQPAAASVDES